MSHERTGQEWFFGMEELGVKFDGLLGVGDDDLTDAVNDLYVSDDDETKAQIAKRIRVDDSLLTGVSEEDKWHERKWIESHKKRAKQSISIMIKSLSRLTISDSEKRALASAICELANVGIQAGPYQPWIERLQNIKFGNAERDTQIGQALQATNGLMVKTQGRIEIARKHIKAAARKPNGRLLRPSKVLSQINADLPPDDQIDSLKTLSRYFDIIEKGQT